MTIAPVRAPREDARIEVTRNNRIAGARPLTTPTPKVSAAVYATRQPGIFHVCTTETAPGGEVLRQAMHRLRAADANTAAVAALWLFNHTCQLPCMGFFVWR